MSMKRITRERKLTAEEAARYDAIRKQTDEELPELIERYRQHREAAAHDKRTIPSVSVTYAADGSSTRSNELGMRPMQERVWQKRGEQYLLIKSPPASGKSRALMFVALDNRKKLEALLHGFFDSARLDMELKDRFDRKVEPREWFLVPLSVINEAVEKIKDGTISDVCYDAGTASLKRA
jgi:hypothetical protein